MKRTRKIWNTSDDEIMIHNYPNMDTGVLAKFLNTTIKAVYSRAKILGLKKASEYIEIKRAKEAELLRKVGAATRYKKGNKPINTGLKQSEYMSPEAIERTKATRFKKGHKPHNHKPIGHTRITKDGYVEVKVAESNRFVLLHRWIWKIWNGPISDNHIITFIDGNQQNCSIENLKMITMQENMMNNTIQRYPEELRDVMQLTGRLKSKIKQKSKNQ